MPKMRTKKAVAKRVKVTATGKLMRSKAYRRHLLGTKNSKRKRQLGKSVEIDPTDFYRFKSTLPYS